MVGGEQAVADPGDDRHGDGVADGAVAGGVADGLADSVQRGPVVREALEAFALARGEPPDSHQRRVAVRVAGTCGVRLELVVAADHGLAGKGGG